jgi:hypothetical protein
MPLARPAAVSALVLAAAALAGPPAGAADQAAAPCDPGLAPGVTWTAPSSLAWGRTATIGADIADPADPDSPAYLDGSIRLAVDAGAVHGASDPVDHDMEFAVTAPARGVALGLTGSWSLADAAGTVTCAQVAAMSVPLAAGAVLRYRASRDGSALAWAPAGAGDCHGAALAPATLTVQQGTTMRRIRVADQCRPASRVRVTTPDWDLRVAGGRFVLRAHAVRSSLRARLRFALRVGDRRVAAGSASLVRVYRPNHILVVGTREWWDHCVHGALKVLPGGNCLIPGARTLQLRLL